MGVIGELKNEENIVWVNELRETINKYPMSTKLAHSEDITVKSWFRERLAQIIKPKKAEINRVNLLARIEKLLIDCEDTAYEVDANIIKTKFDDLPDIHENVREFNIQSHQLRRIIGEIERALKN